MKNPRNLKFRCTKCGGEDVSFPVDEYGNQYAQCNRCGNNTKPPQPTQKQDKPVVKA
jgi:transcription elongation factor Elf1